MSAKQFFSPLTQEKENLKRIFFCSAVERLNIDPHGKFLSPQFREVLVKDISVLIHSAVLQKKKSIRKVFPLNHRVNFVI